MSRWRRPGGGVRGKVPRRRRTRPTHGDSGSLGAGKGLRGTEVPDAVGLGHCTLRGSGDPCLRKGARPIGPACGGDTAPPVGRRDPTGEGAPATKRWAQCQDRQVHAAHCSDSPSTPSPPPAPGSEGVSEDVTGGDYSLVRAVVWLPLTGRSGGWRGRRLRGDRPELCYQFCSLRPAHTRRCPARPPWQSSAQL